MKLQQFRRRALFFLAPDYGGEAVSGGGHPADSVVPATKEVDDTFGQDQRGRGSTPGVGVPGSRTNPVGDNPDEIARRIYALWEEEGRPEGRHTDHWQRAEDALRSGAGRS